MSHLAGELICVLPDELARQTPLDGVERVLVARGAFTDELADEPQFEVDGDEQSQADQGNHRNPKVECRVVEQPAIRNHGDSPFRVLRCGGKED
jgi:hypothetical protein